MWKAAEELPRQFPETLRLLYELGLRLSSEVCAAEEEERRNRYVSRVHCSEAHYTELRGQVNKQLKTLVE
jgi:hypothetical protein